MPTASNQPPSGDLRQSLHSNTPLWFSLMKTDQTEVLASSTPDRGSHCIVLVSPELAL